MISIRFQRDLYVGDGTAFYYAIIHSTKAVACQKRQGAAAIYMLLHGRLACKRHPTTSISCTPSSHASPYADYHQHAILQAAVMSARMISDQAAIAVGAFSVVDTEAGRGGSFAVSLEEW
jgi:hypothetical protein